MKLKGAARSIDLQVLIASEKRKSQVLEDLVAATNHMLTMFKQFLPVVQHDPMFSKSANRAKLDSPLHCTVAVEFEEHMPSMP